MGYVQDMEVHIKTLLIYGLCVYWHQICCVAPTLLGNTTLLGFYVIMMTCCQYEA